MLLRRFRPLPGQATLRGESGCSPLKGTARAEFYCCLPLHRRAAGRVLLRIYHRRFGRHMQADKTHDSCIYSSVNASGRAPGCCAGLLLCVPFLVEGHCGGARKTQATILLFRPFLLAFSSADLPVLLF